MLKYIGDLDKLKDYGFEEMTGVNGYAPTHYYKEYAVGCEVSITKNTKFYGEIEIDVYDGGGVDEELLDTLYTLIKDGLVEKVDD